MDNIIKIFNSQDEIEIKQAFKEILIDRFKEDLEQMDCYLFDPSIFEDMIKDVLQEVSDEFKAGLRTKMQEKLQSVNIDKLLKTK